MLKDEKGANKNCTEITQQASNSDGEEWQWATGHRLYEEPSSCVLLTKAVLHLPMSIQKTANFCWKGPKAF